MTASDEQGAAELHSAHTALDDFRRTVRQRAINGYRDQQWSLERLNESLDRLGLEPFTPQYSTARSVELSITLHAPENSSDTSGGVEHALRTSEAKQAMRNALADVIATYAPDATLEEGDATVWLGEPRREVMNWP